MRRQVMSILGATALLAALTPHAAAARPTCMGKRATIVGTNGDDRLNGTAKDDVIVARGGSDVVNGRGGGDLICGGRGLDIMEGNRGGDRISGGAGQDYLTGGRGSDQLEGGRGADRFLIGVDPHADVIDGGGGRDTLNASIPSRDGDPEGGSEPAHVNLERGFARTERGGRDEVAPGTVENVYGSSHGDRLIGDDGRNVLDAGYSGGGTLWGRGGDDILVTGQDGGTTFFGEDGNDLINAIAGSNTVSGGPGTDTFSTCGPYAGADVPLTADLETGTATLDGEESSLAEIENLEGCGAGDALSGDEQANELIGNGGDDTLAGRAGDDVLDGGAGTDDGDGGDGTDVCEGIESQVNCEG